MRLKTCVIGGFLLLLIVAVATSSFAAEDPVGYVQTAEGTVEITCMDGKTTSAAFDVPVLPQDVITTGEDGKAQIMFIDKTVLALDANSKVEIFDVYTPEKGGLFDMNFFSGTGRIITSKILSQNPEKFSASTPLGTIGIRGTELGLLADPGHEVVMLYEGGPAIYTDEQIPGVSLEEQSDLCKELASSRKKIKKAYDEVAHTMNIVAKRKAQKQLTKINGYLKEYKCAP